MQSNFYEVEEQIPCHYITFLLAIFKNLQFKFCINFWGTHVTSKKVIERLDRHYNV